MMISRRDFLGTTAGLTSASCLHAQDTRRPVFWIKVSAAVTEVVEWRHACSEVQKLGLVGDICGWFGPRLAL